MPYAHRSYAIPEQAHHAAAPAVRNAPPIDLRSIRYLVAIVDEGSFARAATKMNVTQPALSRSVQALERALGVRVLDRGKSGAVPTVFGRLLLDRGRALLSDATAITREIALLSGAETGECLVGVGAYPAEISVGPAAARLLAQRPGLRLRISIGDWPDLTERALVEKLDLAICDLELAENNPRLRVEALPQHPGVLFCRASHPLAGRSNVRLDEVRAFPLALTAVPKRLSPVLPFLETEPSAPSVHVDTVQLSREIVAHSDVIGAAVRSQIAEDVRAGRFVVLPIDLPWLATRYGFIYRAGRTLAPSLQLFMAEVRAVENDIVANDAKLTKKFRPARARSGKHGARAETQ
jgi:DNA-binding transcriptional LysR family regulator